MPIARHKRLPASERKKQIAIEAATLFAKRGLNGVTTKEIAAASGVSEAIIYRFFPTKEALYTEIIDQKVHVRPEIFDMEAAALKGDDEVFKSVARFLLKQVKDDNTFLRLMLYSALEGHDLASLFLKNRANIFFGFLHEYMVRKIKEGAFRNMDPVIAVRSFIGMFFHFIMVRELFKVPKELKVSDENAVDGFVDIYLNGVKK